MRKVAILLRAINVAGGKLLMSDLKRVLAGLGYADPQTLLASGNAVVATAKPADQVEAEVKAALAAELGLRTEVFVRDHAGLKAAMDGNPFGKFAAEHPSRTMVVFLDGAPPEDLSALTRWATAGEEVAAGPRCLYITYPNGAGRSKLANAKGDAAKGTARNWNTVGKLLALTAE
ncbi:DUF1697 domain-containing protein [Phenylobacterium sp. J367]|uniref:DUF1697 domain-containing protein n=1 Tax=Phenylobacterium sp. J367 TaxID=2898435 RepID=UPI0021516EFC|nr:DUF1697 domain-containing protein [Phenylobacterium sp. J367]MCR5879191.1 DUF1697 domain-containing protein [Phenylobacterium sp. J367]